MKKIAICYICTGPYVNFFKSFYETSKKFLLKNYEKHFFVFTNNKEFFSDYISETEDITLTYIDHLPWPLITLLRFNYFLLVEDKLKEFDFVMFANSNLKFVDYVNEHDFLPDLSLGQTLSVTTHAGFYQKTHKMYPLEKNKKSKAYIKPGKEFTYVFGGMYVATSDEFIYLSNILKNNIETDLKNNIIALYHDETHLNHYVSTIEKSKIKLLPYSYCYPYPPELYPEFKKIIVTVNKKDVFDVDKFKSEIFINNKKRKNIRSFLYSNYVNKRGVKKIKFFNIPVYSKKISN